MLSTEGVIFIIFSIFCLCCPILFNVSDPHTYLRFPVFENGSIHSSLDNIRWENSFFSGSKNPFERRNEEVNVQDVCSLLIFYIISYF